MELERVKVKCYENWRKSLKEVISSISVSLYSDGNLYYEVCFVYSEKFKGIDKVKENIIKNLGTDRVNFYYSLPF
jgi:hypothetical protein